MRMRLVVGISGASGAPYAERLLAALAHSSHHVDIVASKIGEEIFRQETGRVLADYVERRTAAGASFRLWRRDDLYAPFSSGSQIYDAMAIVPCSVGAVGRIATGASNDLLSRAADVFLKENRRLVVAVRETPLSEIHLQNMLTLRRAGAVILPASPGFYTRPKDLVELTDSLVQRILDHMGVELRVHKRWREHSKRQDAPRSRSRVAETPPREGAVDLGDASVRRAGAPDTSRLDAGAHEHREDPTRS